MTQITQRPWRVQDHLIEQPSWGGRYIIDLKGLTDDPAWTGKKVGQSYELAKSSVLIDPLTGEHHKLAELIAQSPNELLGPDVVAKFGTDISLLIKLTQAKGNSFQVHLSAGKTLKHWQQKPEAWLYLAPGIFTFGLKSGYSFLEFANALTEIDHEMKRLSAKTIAGDISVGEARILAKEFIRQRDPYRFVNVVEARKDDIVDLTAGGIHHSWEEDEQKYPEGNLVYEVQVDVHDDNCSMRGFDKGKILDNGHLRATHVDDYLKTIEQDSLYNDLKHHLRQPKLVEDTGLSKIESLFRTPYFLLDRITLYPGGTAAQSTARGFHHLFLLQGNVSVGGDSLMQGESYIVPANVGEYVIAAGEDDAIVLKTYLPVE